MENKRFNKNVFSQRLQELMKDNNDTIYSLGEYLGLSPSMISYYTSAIHMPKIPTVEKIARKYSVDPVWLMGAVGIEKYLKNKPEFKTVPILGTVAAGLPILCEEYIEGYECVPVNTKIDFCLKIKGDSMINARIYNGDVVYVRQQATVGNGEIAVVIIDGAEATLKRVYQYNDSIVLRSENPAYKEMVFTKKDFKNIIIAGKCMFVKFKV